VLRRTLVVFALAAVALAGCEPALVPPGTGRSATADPRLRDLVVATARSMRGYSRARFATWRTTGPNCDVRDSMLRRDGQQVRLRGCNVVGGRWVSVYDGLTVTRPSEVDIDHLVPLANAWRSGADTWTDAERADFANDLDDPELVVATASSNRSKGDQDPSQWKPDRRAAWCVYARDWITVKARWKLTVTRAERDALADMLETCG
jgi:hypothetical protein